MEHIYKTRIKTFSDSNLELLEHDINDFCADNDAVTINISVSYKPKEWKVATKRESLFSYAEKYRAAIIYRVDWTEEMVRADMTQWVLGRLDAERAPRTWVDPVTLMEQSNENMLMRKWDELLATDEAKALRKELEIKYSKEEK